MSFQANAFQINAFQQVGGAVTGPAFVDTAFQNNSFQVIGLPPAVPAGSNTRNLDLDMSGSSWHKSKVYLGPSLGWKEVQVKPTTLVTSLGTYFVTPGDSIILVNAVGGVTIQLPDVVQWVQEIAYQPATGFERAIWIKDLGGNAAASNIIVAPFGAQTIDLLVQSFIMVQNRQLLRLYPLNDLTGWYSG
ncbi:MAG TPA: hypothetical protein VH187_05585 [Scandinavium sp.]|uniref:hypothetical protein n=1 Tax=Scandinavium sp. TaxID=2830653 RepID=UPI002E366934|nr:hypothetical protein [Scandinavium sp.]HEX4500633.1 hypothetical protein [Scandinavium sp.]